MTISATPRTPVVLGDLIEIRHGFAFDGKFFADKGRYVLLTPGNFRDEGGFKDRGNSQKHYSGSAPPDFILRPGDLLVAMTEQAEGLLGSAAFVPEGKPCLHNQRLGLIRTRPGAPIDLKFVYYLFNTRKVRQQIRASATGVKVRHTSPSRIYDVRVPLPPLQEQRRIASILSAYDDLIEVNRRRIALLGEIRRRIFDEWFVELRFPGHETVRISAGKVGPIPDGWRRCELRDVANVNRRSVKPNTASTTIRYVDIASVSPDSIDGATEIAFSEAPGRARRQVSDGSVIWSTVRPNRRSHALVLDPPPNMIVSTGFAVLDATAVPFSFLYEAVTTDQFVGYLTNHATGSAYPAVTGETFERALLLIPSKRLLDVFHQHAEPQLRLADNLRRANGSLVTARDLLLPRLVSGELSVSSAKREIERAA